MHFEDISSWEELLSLYLCKETDAMLNDIATVVNGPAGSFKVHYWGVKAKLFDNPIHKHSFFEVCYVLDGEGTYTEHGQDYPLRAGTHFCSRPGVTHQIRTDEGLFLLYAAFELDEAKSNEGLGRAYRHLEEHGEICVHDQNDAPTAHIWKLLLLEEANPAKLPMEAIPSLAYTLLLSYLTLFGQNNTPTTIQPRSSHMLLQQAKLYIRDNLSGALRLQHVAAYLCVSERHLSRLFSAGIHETFTDFIRKERIRLASHLLLSSDMSIKEIAEQTGFSSVHYFSRAFMEDKHVPPGKFRRDATPSIVDLRG